jgi:hypothetical protein
MLNRLAYELDLREQLEVKRVAMDAKRANIVTEIDRTRTFLSSISGQLEAIARAAAPLREGLGLAPGIVSKTGEPGTSVISATPSRAVLLPTPLYIIYTQIAALSDVGEGCAVEIEGDDDDAAAWSDPPAVADGAAARAVTGDEHPLSVIVTVAFPPAGRLPVRFRYLARRKLVTAELGKFFFFFFFFFFLAFWGGLVFVRLFVAPHQGRKKKSLISHPREFHTLNTIPRPTL